MMRIRASVFSHVGNCRQNHEDNYLLGKRYLLPEQVKQMSQLRKLVADYMELSDSFCVAVSDGMGGYECGEVASLLTVQYLFLTETNMCKMTPFDKWEYYSTDERFF